MRAEAMCVRKLPHCTQTKDLRVKTPSSPLPVYFLCIIRSDLKSPQPLEAPSCGGWAGGAQKHANEAIKVLSCVSRVDMRRCTS